MIKIDPVIKLLKKEKEMHFDKIFKEVKDQLVASDSEFQLKSDLYSSMLDTKILIMIGNNVWGLRENFTTNEVERIERMNLGIVTDDESINTELEESEETREINGLLLDDDNDDDNDDDDMDEENNFTIITEENDDN